MSPVTEGEVRTCCALAAEILRTHGWCRGRFRNDQGEYCVAGALNRATGGSEDPWLTDRVLWFVSERLPDSVKRSIAEWNDNVCPDAGAAIAFLEHCAKEEAPCNDR